MREITLICLCVLPLVRKSCRRKRNGVKALKNANMRKRGMGIS